MPLVRWKGASKLSLYNALKKLKLARRGCLDLADKLKSTLRPPTRSSLTPIPLSQPLYPWRAETQPRIAS